jgi:chromosome segregation ATPase
MTDLPIVASFFSLFNLPLVYELLLLASLALLISWFMGRSFCKSKEYPLRASNSLLKKENKRLERVLEKKETKQQQLIEKLRTEQDQISELAHHSDRDKRIISALKKEQEEILETAQSLSSYKLQFEQLNLSHNRQSKQLIELENNQKQAEKIEKKVVELAQKNKKLEDINADQSKNIKQLIQQTKMDKGVMTVLEKEQQNTLNRVQGLSAYKTQFEQLTQYHDEQSKQIIDLKKSKQQKVGVLEQEVQKIADLNTHKDEKIKQLTQQVEKDKTRIAVLKQAQEEISHTVSSLSPYKTQFEQLTQHHDALSKQVIDLKMNKQKMVGKLERESKKIADLNTHQGEEITRLRLQIKTDKGVITVLEKEQQDTFNTVQGLSAYKMQFEQLTQYHEALSKQVIDVKISKQKKIGELERESKKILKLNHHQSEQIQALEQQLAVYSEVATSNNIKITNMLNGFSIQETT